MITVEQFIDVLKHIKNKEGAIYYNNGVFDYFIGSIIVLNGYVIFLKSMFKSESLNIRELVSKLLSQCEPHYKILIIGSKCYMVNSINDVVANKLGVRIKCTEYKSTNDSL